MIPMILLLVIINIISLSVALTARRDAVCPSLRLDGARLGGNLGSMNRPNNSDNSSNNNGNNRVGAAQVRALDDGV